MPCSAQTRGRLADDRIAKFLTQLFRFRIAVEPGLLSRALVEVRSLARLHRLTTYDASYLELAFRRSLPLATWDLDLKKAAGAAGVSLLDTP
jgi:predicted nucleic acid-binding protein